LGPHALSHVRLRQAAILQELLKLRLRQVALAIAECLVDFGGGRLDAEGLLRTYGPMLLAAVRYPARVTGPGLSGE
jgi:hypothetical protein